MNDCYCKNKRKSLDGPKKHKNIKKQASSSKSLRHFIASVFQINPPLEAATSGCDATLKKEKKSRVRVVHTTTI